MAAPPWLTLPWSEVSGSTFLVPLLVFAASTPGSPTALGRGPVCLALSYKVALVSLLKVFSKNMCGVRCETQSPAARCLEQVIIAGVLLSPLTLSLSSSWEGAC